MILLRSFLSHSKALTVIHGSNFIGHLTAKSDVYSFGVVLLEMLSGRRAIDKNRPPGEHNLVEWARPYLPHKRKIFRVLDTRVEGQYSLVAAHKAAALASHCLSTEAKCRPTMDEVASTLELLQDNKDAAKQSQSEPRVNSQSLGISSGHKLSERNLQEAGTRSVSYPRPSPLLS